MKYLTKLLKTGMISVLVWGTFAVQADQIPPCLDHGQILPISNEQVLDWKKHPQDPFKARAHVKGKVTKLYEERSNHAHFQIELTSEKNSTDKDTLEIIYSLEFGALFPPVQVGAQIEACGDYLTAMKETPGPDGKVYHPSPDKAILHWVHISTSSYHDSGFLSVNGKVFGMQIPPSHQLRGR